MRARQQHVSADVGPRLLFAKHITCLVSMIHHNKLEVLSANTTSGSGASRTVLVGRVTGLRVAVIVSAGPRLAAAPRRALPLARAPARAGLGLTQRVHQHLRNSRVGRIAKRPTFARPASRQFSGFVHRAKRAKHGGYEAAACNSASGKPCADMPSAAAWEAPYNRGSGSERMGLRACVPSCDASSARLLVVAASEEDVRRTSAAAISSAVRRGPFAVSSCGRTFWSDC